MEKKYKYFILLAEMRTGSNFLEESLNQIAGISCLGEAFNPVFVGHAGKAEMLGISKQERDRDPNLLLQKIARTQDGISGFRYFHDHDPRILDTCLSDQSCAKIVLSRNPVDTYVSQEIVRKTGQWRLGDLKNAKSAKAEFDKTRFQEHLEAHTKFQQRILRELQRSGQTAFYLDYEDIASGDVLSGIAKFLGVKAEIPAPSRKTKKQNPGTLEERVANFQEMELALNSYDYFGLNRTPNFEPRRGPMIPHYVAAGTLPLLYMPIPGGPVSSVTNWMAQADGSEDRPLIEGFSQKELRQWKRRLKRHLSFTVVSHPVERLFRTFADKIALQAPLAFHEIRIELIKNYGVPIVEGASELSDYSNDQLRSAFVGFAAFVKGNLNGQTNVRVDPAWASQGQMIQGFAQFMSPDHILRSERIEKGLAFITQEIGLLESPDFRGDDQTTAALKEIFDKKLEATVKAAYQKDYMMFGYGPWNSED